MACGRQAIGRRLDDVPDFFGLVVIMAPVAGYLGIGGRKIAPVIIGDGGIGGMADITEPVGRRVSINEQNAVIRPFDGPSINRKNERRVVGSNRPYRRGRIGTNRGRVMIHGEPVPNCKTTAGYSRKNAGYTGEPIPTVVESGVPNVHARPLLIQINVGQCLNRLNANS